MFFPDLEASGEEAEVSLYWFAYEEYMLTCSPADSVADRIKKIWSDDTSGRQHHLQFLVCLTPSSTTSLSKCSINHVTIHLPPIITTKWRRDNERRKTYLRFWNAPTYFRSVVVCPGMQASNMWVLWSFHNKCSGCV